MSTERAIIVHTEFVKQCVKVGRTVVEELKEAINNNEEISDERIEKLFTPLIDFVEKETDTRVSRETDEIRAKLKEDQEQEEKEDAVNAIRNELDDTFIVNVNGKRKFYYASHKTKRLKQAMCDTEVKVLFPEIESATVIDAPPAKNPANLIEDPNLLNENVDSEYWWDYCPQVDITVPPPGHKLLPGGTVSLLAYIDRKEWQFSAMENYIPYFKTYEENFGNGWCPQKLTELAKVCDKALAGEKLQPKELYDLLSGRSTYAISGPAMAMARFLEHRYKL